MSKEEVKVKKKTHDRGGQRQEERRGYVGHRERKG